MSAERSMRRAQRAVRPLVIGITGGIGSGKSTVAAALVADSALATRLGGAVRHLDADELLRAARAGDPSLRRAILALHPAARLPDGEIDTRTLAAAAFGQPDLLRALEALQWPIVVGGVAAAGRAAAREGVACLLVEAIALEPLAGELDGALLLDAAVADRRERAAARGISADDFDRRDAAQAAHLAAARAAGARSIDASGSPAAVARAAAGAIVALCSADEARADSPR